MSSEEYAGVLQLKLGFDVGAFELMQERVNLGRRAAGSRQALPDVWFSLWKMLIRHRIISSESSFGVFSQVSSSELTIVWLRHENCLELSVSDSAG